MEDRLSMHYKSHSGMHYILQPALPELDPTGSSADNLFQDAGEEFNDAESSFSGAELDKFHDAEDFTSHPTPDLQLKYTAWQEGEPCRKYGDKGLGFRARR